MTLTLLALPFLGSGASAAGAPEVPTAASPAGRALAEEPTLEQQAAALSATQIDEAALDTAVYNPADEDGANDVPGQVDVTQLWLWSVDDGTLDVAWSWDEQDWSGNNTGDACALFDTDEDGNANFAVCVTIDDNPAVQVEGSPRVYECKDTDDLKCFDAELVVAATTDCVVDQTATDPFTGGALAPTDTTALCAINLDDVNAANATPLITNVCSYPSQIPNSNPFDCVLAPRDALLTIKKVLSPAQATPESFDFTVTTPTAGEPTVQSVPVSSGDADGVSLGVASGKDVTVSEVTREGWLLLSASCTNGATADPVDSPITLNLRSGLEVTCTFTNTRAASVKVDKAWVINGVSYSDADKPEGYSTALELSGNGDQADVFGTVYSGYQQGDSATIGEGPVTVPAGCANTISGDTGTKTLAGGLNTFTITNTVSCAASVKVSKAWVINGVSYSDADKPAGYSATLQLSANGDVADAFGTTYSGYRQGDTVTIGEATPVTMPQGCINTATGDIGTRTLGKGLNTFTITNTVECAASVTVDKEWMINGVAYDDGDQPAGFSASLTLTGQQSPSFGATYSDYHEGETVTVGEVSPVTMPEGCTNTATGDIGQRILDKGPNELTITNTVTCAASVVVDKKWVINGVAYDDGEQPEGYSATLTLTGNTGDDEFGTTYGGYSEGASVTIGEATPVTMPSGCINAPTGDLGQRTLKKGLNAFTITNTVTCAASVVVEKGWVINGVAYDDGEQPEGYSATLTLTDNIGEDAFSTVYVGYTEGDRVTIGEAVSVPASCVNDATGDSGEQTLDRGLNEYTLTNTVTCGASVQVDKEWVINGVAYDDGDQPDGYSATLQLSGNGDATDAFGTTYPGYRQGQSVTIGEVAPITLPNGCTNAATGDLGTEILAKGLNTFTITNTVTCQSSVEVIKRDAVNQAPLDGATFELYLDRGTVGARDDADVRVGSPVVTGSDGHPVGTYRWNGLGWDRYILVETKAPAGYLLSTPSFQAFQLGASDGSTSWVTFTFLNPRVPPPPPPPGTVSVQVVKVDGVTGSPIDTAKFKLWRDTGSAAGVLDALDSVVSPGEVSTGTSGYAAGTYLWPGLSQGAYLLQETAAPTGYDLSSPAVQAFTLTSAQVGTTVTKTVRNPQQDTTVEVVKVDDETGEVLQGAVFQAYEDDGTATGVLDDEDTPIGDPVTTDAAGEAAWDGLLFGSYLFEEVAAPEGYGLPEVSVQAVTITPANAGGVIELRFLDPALGTLTLDKATFELNGSGDWVVSDGRVDFGDRVKYVVTATADGPKVHHDVVVSDYIPGYDPGDTTSDTQGIYVAGTAACADEGACAVRFDDAEQLLTWELGDLRDETRSVEFVIEFPEAGDESSMVEGVYTETLANTAAVTWTDRAGDQEVDSNEVTVDAEIEVLPAEEERPVKPRPPAVLPETGAPAAVGTWTTIGGLMLAVGVLLLMRRRRDVP